MRRRIWISSIAVTLVVVSILLALYANNSLSPSQGINAPSDFPDSDVMTMGSHYLFKPPYFPNSTNNLTEIYLESATLSYDYSNVSFTGDPISHDDFVGVPAVIINATIRNDYNVEEIIQFSQQGSSDLNFAIDVYLYDEEGTIVPTIHQGNLRGCKELSLKSGESITAYMVFATPNRNIDHFEIYVSYLPTVTI